MKTVYALKELKWIDTNDSHDVMTDAINEHMLCIGFVKYCITWRQRDPIYYFVDISVDDDHWREAAPPCHSLKEAKMAAVSHFFKTYVDSVFDDVSELVGWK